jgi:hypothetical protein
MIHNAMRELSGVNDFLGHYSSDEFIIVTSIHDQFELGVRVKTRIEQSLEYFYPLRDRERKRLIHERLFIRIRMLSSDQWSYSSLSELKSGLAKAGLLE